LDSEPSSSGRLIKRGRKEKVIIIIIIMKTRDREGEKINNNFLFLNEFLYNECLLEITTFHTAIPYANTKSLLSEVLYIMYAYSGWSSCSSTFGFSFNLVGLRTKIKVVFLFKRAHSMFQLNID